MKLKLLIFAMAALALAAVPSRAAAQVSLTPFAGATFGEDAPDSQLTFGASLAATGTIAGAELDFGYTPDFFAQDSDVVLIGDNNVTTLMANLLLGYFDGPIRPYGAVGVGLIRSHVDGGDLFDDVTSNDFGFNVGGGVMGQITEHVGLRGDIRYFRGLRDDDNDNDLDLEVGDFDFWRAYGGVTFGF